MGICTRNSDGPAMWCSTLRCAHPGWSFFNEIRNDYDFKRYALSVVQRGKTRRRRVARAMDAYC